MFWAVSLVDQLVALEQHLAGNGVLDRLATDAADDALAEFDDLIVALVNGAHQECRWWCRNPAR